MKVMGMGSRHKNETKTMWPYVIGLAVVLGSEFLVRVVFFPNPATDGHIRTCMVQKFYPQAETGAGGCLK
jgi:hypothetical protein